MRAATPREADRGLHRRVAKRALDMRRTLLQHDEPIGGAGAARPEIASDTAGGRGGGASPLESGSPVSGSSASGGEKLVASVGDALEVRDCRSVAASQVKHLPAFAAFVEAHEGVRARNARPDGVGDVTNAQRVASGCSSGARPMSSPRRRSSAKVDPNERLPAASMSCSTRQASRAALSPLAASGV